MFMQRRKAIEINPDWVLEAAMRLKHSGKSQGSALLFLWSITILRSEALTKSVVFGNFFGNPCVKSTEECMAFRDRSYVQRINISPVHAKIGVPPFPFASLCIDRAQGSRNLFQVGVAVAVADTAVNWGECQDDKAALRSTAFAEQEERMNEPYVGVMDPYSHRSSPGHNAWDGHYLESSAVPLVLRWVETFWYLQWPSKNPI